MKIKLKCRNVASQISPSALLVLRYDDVFNGGDGEREFNIPKKSINVRGINKHIKTKAIKLKVLYFVAFIPKTKRKNNLYANYHLFASGFCYERNGEQNVIHFGLPAHL